MPKLALKLLFIAPLLLGLISQPARAEDKTSIKVVLDGKKLDYRFSIQGEGRGPSVFIFTGGETGIHKGNLDYSYPNAEFHAFANTTYYFVMTGDTNMTIKATAWTQGKAGAAGTLANSGTFRITQNKKGNEVTLEDFTHPEAVKVTTRTFLFGGKSPNNDIITFKDPSDVSK